MRGLIDPYTPIPGFVTIVMMLDADKFVSWIPADKLDEYAGNFARGCGVRPGDETSQRRQLALRTCIVEMLRGPCRTERWNNFANLGCLWLALNHYSGFIDLRRELKNARSLARGAFLSTGAHSGAGRESHWFFIVSDAMHDGRPQLDSMEAGHLAVDRTGEVAGPPLRSTGERYEIIATADGLPFKR